MDEQALERARKRIASARDGRFEATRMEAALDRARAQVETLTTAAADLELQLPGRVGEAVREGVRREVLPVGRTLAEIKGLANQANRRLERVEQELIAERNARIDDLALLVDLVSTGWHGVDDRLRRIERAVGQGHSNGEVVQLPTAPAEDEHIETAIAS